MTEHYYTDIPFSKISTFIIKPSIRNRNYQFKTCSGVFSYKKLDKGTDLLLKYLEIPDYATNALDMGCGYGAIGIVIATEFPNISVTMVDINRRAVWIARENAELNKTTNIKIHWGDFYNPLRNQKYEVIVSNPPLALGHEKIINFISESPLYLNKNGYFYLVIRTRQGAKKLSDNMKKIFGNVELLKIQSGYRLFRSQQKNNQKV